MMAEDGLAEVYGAEREIAAIESQFPVKIEWQKVKKRSSLLESMDGGTATAIVFVLGAVSASFFSEIGKDLWKQCKMLCRKVFGRRPSKKSRIERAVVTWEHDGSQFRVQIDTKGIDSVEFTARFETDPLDYFWDNISCIPSELAGTRDGAISIASRAPKISIRLTQQGWQVVPGGLPSEPKSQPDL